MTLDTADTIMNLIDDFKTDVSIKEQQLEQLLDHNKEMVDIAEVLSSPILPSICIDIHNIQRRPGCQSSKSGPGTDYLDWNGPWQKEA